VILLHAKEPRPPQATVGLRLGEIDVSVRSCEDVVLEDFQRLYHGYPAAGGAGMSIGVDVQRVGRFLPTCRVFSGGEPIGPGVRSADALPFVEWGLNYQLVGKRADYLCVHAAVLSRHGQGVLFPAQSGSGKSTLAAGLLTRGWKYLSDEVALIDPATLRVHPFPKALCIKSGAFAQVRGLDLPFVGRRHYVKGAKGHVAYVNPLCMGPGALGSHCPIRFVILPRFVCGSEPRLLRLSPAQAAFELTRNAMNRSAFGDRAIGLLTEVAERAEAFSLRTGSLRETGALLDALLDRSLS
jgi:hypothetical protein